MIKLLIIPIFAVLLFPQTVSSQQTSTGYPLEDRRRIEGQKALERWRESNRNRIPPGDVNLRNARNRLQNIYNRAKTVNRAAGYNEETFKKAVSPHPYDLEKYKSFLRQKNTGIFRLLPNFDCEAKIIIRVNGDCLNFIPGSWAYSLRIESYIKENFQDLSFKRDHLIADGILSQGILVSLGDKNLDDLSLKSPGIDFLKAFKPQTDRRILKQQHKKISEGINQNGFFYSNKIIPVVNTTYALRTIAYQLKDKFSSRFRGKNVGKTNDEERMFGSIKYDERDDSIYVFRIIRKSEEDGGITILWKRLSKEKSPKIVFEKNEKLEDFKPGK